MAQGPVAGTWRYRPRRPSLHERTHVDLVALVRILLRRWYVVVAMLAVTVVGAWLVNEQVPPTYEASGYVVLEEPGFDPGNLPRALVDMEALAAAVSDTPPSGVSPSDFSVTADDDESWDILAAGSSETAAARTAAAVADELAGLVEAAQTDIDADERVSAVLQTPSIVAEQQSDGSFVAQARVSLRNPADDRPNPFGANGATKRLLQVHATGNSGTALFQERVGPGIEFDVTQSDRDAAPLLEITTAGSVPDEVIDAFYVVRDILAEELDERQERAQVLPTQRITVEVFDPPLEAEDVSPPLERAVAAVVLVGGLLTLAMVFVVDAWSRRRVEGVGPSPVSSGTAPDPRSAQVKEGTAWSRSARDDSSRSSVDSTAGSANAGQLPGPAGSGGGSGRPSNGGGTP